MIIEYMTIGVIVAFVGTIIYITKDVIASH